MNRVKRFIEISNEEESLWKLEFVMSKPGLITKLDVNYEEGVRSVAFHPTRPYVACGLMNGAVHLWDYRMNTHIDTYKEHSGVVRSIKFHNTQPLMATSSDDGDVRVWNIQLKRCMFALHHGDAVRCVDFHPREDWLATACDDHVMRIWNFKTRKCIAQASAHQQYVMSVHFHPHKPLAVTASMDSTIILWDTSALVDNPTSGGTDFFSNSEVVRKFSLDNHEQTVNCAMFHPTKDIIISGSDDRSVRSWRMDDLSCTEVNCFVGHHHHVTGVICFRDNYISVGEDRRLCVWDPSSRTGEPILKVQRERDRFWAIASHPTNNLLAAAHDAGIIVFKLQRERPAFTIHNGVVYWVREQSVRTYDFESKTESNPMSLRRHPVPPRTLSCNPADSMAVFWYEGEGGYYELCTIPRPGAVANQELKKGVHYSSAVFFSANKFATLDRTNQIVIRTSTNDAPKTPLPAVGNANRILPGPPGFILLRSDTTVYMFHVAQKAVVGEVPCASIRYAAWDKDFMKVALLSPRGITICSRKLKQITTIYERNIKVKSACFDEERDVLLYTTASHLKYCNLRTGETGTIRSTENTIYLVRASGNKVWFLTREAKIVLEEIDNPEMAFKLALQQERYRDVLKLIQSKKLQGEALVSYLHSHNHPEIAMHFVADPWIKFNLAIESGDMAIAKETALVLNRRDAWRILADSASRYGDIQLGQLANSKANNLSGLAHQCLLTGNLNTLQALIDKSKDPNFQMQYSLFTGDIARRLQILLEANQLPLAHALAASNGMDDIAEEILTKMDPEVAERCAARKIGAAVKPPAVEAVTDNWPLLPVQETYFARMLKEPGLLDYQPDTGVTEAGGWGDDDDDLFGEPADADAEESAQAGGATTTAAAGAWDDDDLDIDIDIDGPATTSQPLPSGGGFVLPREGESFHKHWTNNSRLAAHHVAAGAFDSAIDLLKRQVDLCNAQPLARPFMAIWASANASMPSFGIMPSHNFALATRPSDEDMSAKHSPMIPRMLPQLTERINGGFVAVTERRFEDAITIFQSVMHNCLLCVVEDRKELAQLQGLISTCKEYIFAASMEVYRKSVTDPGKVVELAAYFTHCNLQNSHLVLSLRQAMTLAYKQRCFATAIILARRVLDYDPDMETSTRARKVIAAGEKEGGADAIKLDYSDRNPFQLCSVDRVPMYRGTVEPVKCSFCFAVAKPQHAGKTCPICEIAKLGGNGSGMINGAFQTN